MLHYIEKKKTKQGKACKKKKTKNKKNSYDCENMIKYEDVCLVYKTIKGLTSHPLSLSTQERLHINSQEVQQEGDCIRKEYLQSVCILC